MTKDKVQEYLDEVGEGIGEGVVAERIVDWLGLELTRYNKKRVEDVLRGLGFAIGEGKRWYESPDRKLMTIVLKENKEAINLRRVYTERDAEYARRAYINRKKKKDKLLIQLGLPPRYMVRKKYKSLTVNIDVELYKKFLKLVKQYGVNKSAFMNFLLEQEVNSHLDEDEPNWIQYFPERIAQ